MVMTRRPGLFVYGTLCKGQSQHGLVAHLNPRVAKVDGRLYSLSAGYPALSVTSKGWVWGELLEAPSDSLLQILDVYEGVHEGLFRRVNVDVFVGLTRHRAWTYIMDNPQKHKGSWIEGGRWRRVKTR